MSNFNRVGLLVIPVLVLVGWYWSSVFGLVGTRELQWYQQQQQVRGGLQVIQDGSGPEGDFKYGIIVDAGSTQTRLYIYQWQGPSNASYSPHVKPMLERSTGQQARFIKEGGIADMKPSELPSFFRGMVKYAIKQVPREKQSRTPIYVMATAGVRILSNEKQVKVVETLTEYLSDLENSPFKLDKSLGVQVLPGEFEGAFDWLTENYLAGTLRRESVKESLISIDMGGSSIELTFEPTDMLKGGAFPLRVNGTDSILYTESYLKYGRNQALLRYRQDLVAKLSSSNLHKVNDPCFPKGYVEEASYDDYRRHLKFIGTGDYELCRILTRELLRESKFCPAAPCAMNGRYQPRLPTDRPIIAIDGFAKLANWLECPSQSNLNCLEQSAIRMCSNTRLDSTTVHLFRGPSRTVCFLAAYATNVLRRGFHIDAARPIRFTDYDLDGTSTGWTMGAMIYVLEILSFNNGDCGVPDSPDFTCKL